MSVPSGLQSTSTTGFPSPENILGPMLIGGLLSTALWGVTCVQTYDYFMRPLKDRLPQKLIVVLLCALDTFDTAVNAHFLYHYTVKNYANPDALLSATWSISCRSLLTSLSNFIVRAVFARRIYLVSGNNIILTLSIMAISTADFVVGTLITVRSFEGLGLAAIKEISHLLYLGLSLGIVSDLSVTVVFCWLLQSVKVGYRKTDTLVNLLMIYVVNTGLLVVVDAVLGMVMFVVMPDNLTYLGFFLLLSKLYINAYLAVLNARGHLRKNQTDLSAPISRMLYKTATTSDGSDKPSSPSSSNTDASGERRTDDHEMDALELV